MKMSPNTPMNKMKAQIPILKIHLPFPDVLFLFIQFLVRGPPAIDKKVVSATTKVHVADPKSPEFSPIAWRLQYAPGPIAFSASHRLARRLPKLCTKSSNQLEVSQENGDTSDKKVYEPEIALRMGGGSSRHPFPLCKITFDVLVRKKSEQ